ncbi:pilus assembly protein PilP [Alkalilimnicola ehrlichii]|uniref:pilus assembly protein PilP n=1 Tax=Alkalilimnicola ehrlichii TaxID=351052 RepID=UPI003B9DFCE7
MQGRNSHLPFTLWRGRFWMALAVLLLAGCSEDMSDLERKIAEPAPESEIGTIPSFEEPAAVHFPATLPRDPFRPLGFGPEREEEVLTVAVIDPDRPREPLEYFQRDSLRFVGTLGRGGVRYAMIQDPEQRIHLVTVGNYLGRASGRIEEIAPERIVLTEKVRDRHGQVVERPAALNLQPAQ